MRKVCAAQGEISVTDFQLAFINIDDELDNALSHSPKVLRIKKRWALDDFQLQREFMYYVLVYNVASGGFGHRAHIRKHM